MEKKAGLPKKPSPKKQNKKLQIHSTKVHQIAEAIAGQLGPTQGARLVEFLAKNPGELSGTIAAQCAIQNVSSAAGQVRDILRDKGFVIVCHLPTPLVKNRFGQPSRMHRWSIEAVR